ncbi:MAG: oxygen-dependent coproporphyrinogen-III oxidase [Lysobacteraceae bacterium]|nr:MAG: oxygen-dependent coproporphyrinogen-III oxidase [Xanthomonadaceae bacterium]
MAENEQLAQVIAWLKGLQDSICEQIGGLEPTVDWHVDRWRREEGGGGDTRVLEGGEVIERGGVNFSHVVGQSLPPSASARKPELAGRRFAATGVSLVMHPRNPFAPTSHMNVRFFIAEKDGEAPVWWFGGGFDLTPYYPFSEDVDHWHGCARKALTAFDDSLYQRYRRWCDEYFYLPHRNEHRGVGGLFFDDLDSPDGDGPNFSRSFELTRSVGEQFAPAWVPIVEKRKDHSYEQRQRDFQLYRRGRYVEFNLVYDRGTLFGLQSRGRTESILMSMPPQAQWRYDWTPEPGSEEQRIMDYVTPPSEPA